MYFSQNLVSYFHSIVVWSTEKKKVRDDDDDHDLNDGRDDIEEEEIDEELDEGTDYANQYFDNGESYLDEDDNLEDEAAYS